MKSVPTLLTLVLLLTACGGGGGGLVTPAGPGESPGMSQPPSQETGEQPGNGSGSVPTRSASPVSQTSPTKQPSLSAKGVTVSMTLNGSIATFDVREGEHSWTREGFKYLPGGSGHGDWTNTTTKLNNDANKRFRVTTDIAGASDLDYIAYGYWSRHPSTSLYHGDFESFYYGSMPYASNVKNLSGQAIYTGDAMGTYTIKHASASLSYGYFEGQVSLTASFGPSGGIEGSMTGIRNIEELYLNGHDPLSDFVDQVQFSAEYDSSGRSFAGDGWGGYFLGPSGSGQTPTGSAGWFEGLTIEHRSCKGFTCTRAILDGSFGAQRE